MEMERETTKEIASQKLLDRLQLTICKTFGHPFSALSFGCVFDDELNRSVQIRDVRFRSANRNLESSWMINSNLNLLDRPDEKQQKKFELFQNFLF